MKSENGGFSARELRALLWLLPVLAVVSWIVWGVASDPGETILPSVLTDGQPGDTITRALARQNDRAEARSSGADPDRSVKTDGDIAAADDESSPKLFTFDPNTVEYHDLVRLGFERGEALGIVKYRERGKVFEIPEDFAACYQVSEAMYRRLAPYIRIGERYRLKRWAETRSGGAVENEIGPKPDGDGVSSDPPVKTDGNIAAAPSLRVSDPRDHGAARPLRPALVDLNTADSATLVSVPGIGSVTAPRIVEYRARLGGFAAVEQLAEVRGVTEQNYERMVQQIYVDPAVIQKIDINFAPAKSLAGHPYIGAAALRKLLKERQLKGGWRNAEELAKDDIFTVDELTRLGPYLVFN